ncbi:MAG TPA: glycosyltransferase family 39 protein [Gemmatimonadales bacterium]|nr:glycosyltransferase family 39 protein [Gemmatimonadales bacterium]
MSAPDPTRSAAPERAPFAARTVLALAGATLLLHLVTNLVTGYGIHRDEFLYFAMGDHLRLFRMDFPPGIAVLSAASRFLLGDSLVALRLAPALAATAIVVLAALLARELGGGRWAQGFAALAVAGSVFFQRAGNLFQPVILDALWWTAGCYALARLCRAEGPAGPWWGLLALAGGIGLFTKFSILFFGFGVLVALLATPWRRTLLTRWPWLVLLVALALGSPSIVGQIALGWPLAGQMRTLQHDQLAHVSVAGFFLVQLMFGPAMLVGACGLLALLLAPALRPFRLVGWTCLSVWVVLIALHGKAYYVGATYPVLFAAGAAALERLRSPRLGAHLRGWAAGLTAAYGVLVLPLGVPLLPPAAMERYVHTIGATEALRDNQGQYLRLPQDYADMLGWQDRVRALATAYVALPPLERAQAVIIANNFGEAGAAEFYGPKIGLPPVVCAQGSYWFFGPGTRPGVVAITIGEGREGLRRLYDSVEVAGRLTNPLTVREEQVLTVYVARRPRETLQEVWTRVAGRY